MGRYKLLDSLKSFLSYVSHIWGQHPASWLFTSLIPPSPLRVVAADSCWITGIVLPLGGSAGPENHIERPQITGGCYILIYWYGRRHSVSHWGSTETLIPLLWLQKDRMSPLISNYLISRILKPKKIINHLDFISSLTTLLFSC